MAESDPTKDNPLVSVIMPAYNCAQYIGEAIESILEQTYSHLELIVIDDASTDTTWEVIQDYVSKDARVRSFRNGENLKISRTLNRAIRESKGKYLARMDGDDIRTRDGISKQVDYMDAHDDVVVVGGSIVVCDEDMRPLNTRRYIQGDSEIRQKLFRFSPFAHGSIMMRASAVPDDPYELDWAEDYDLYFRLGKTGRFANLPDVLYQLRTHKASVSRSKTFYQEKLTLYIRLKAVFEYGYRMTMADKAYFATQYLTLHLMPSSIRFTLFNRIRRFL